MQIRPQNPNQTVKQGSAGEISLKIPSLHCLFLTSNVFRNFSALLRLKCNRLKRGRHVGNGRANTKRRPGSMMTEGPCCSCSFVLYPNIVPKSTNYARKTCSWAVKPGRVNRKHQHAHMTDQSGVPSWCAVARFGVHPPLASTVDTEKPFVNQRRSPLTRRQDVKVQQQKVRL